MNTDLRPRGNFYCCYSLIAFVELQWMLGSMKRLLFNDTLVLNSRNDGLSF
jgi:hypothetical protein